MASPRVLASAHLSFSLDPIKSADGHDIILGGNLTCLPSAAIDNTVAEQVQRKCREWERYIGFVADKNGSANASGEEQFFMMVAGVLKDQTLDVKLLATKLVTTFALFENAFEKFAARKEYQREIAVNAFKPIGDIFAGRYQSHEQVPVEQLFPLHKKFGKAFSEIYEVLKDKGELTYLHESVMHYLEGLLTIKDRSPYHHLMSEQTFLSLREHTDGKNIILELMSILTKNPMNESEQRGLLFAMMKRKVLHVTATLKDMISIRQDLKNNNTENLVLIKMSHSSRPLDLKHAFQETRRYFNSQLRELLEMPAWAKMDAPLLRYYDQVIIPTVRDSIDWYFTYAKCYGNMKHERSDKKPLLRLVSMYNAKRVPSKRAESMAVIPAPRKTS